MKFNDIFNESFALSFSSLKYFDENQGGSKEVLEDYASFLQKLPYKGNYDKTSKGLEIGKLLDKMYLENTTARVAQVPLPNPDTNNRKVYDKVVSLFKQEVNRPENARFKERNNLGWTNDFTLIHLREIVAEAMSATGITGTTAKDPIKIAAAKSDMITLMLSLINERTCNELIVNESTLATLREMQTSISKAEISFLYPETLVEAYIKPKFSATVAVQYPKLSFQPVSVYNFVQLYEAALDTGELVVGQLPLKGELDYLNVCFKDLDEDAEKCLTYKAAVIDIKSKASNKTVRTTIQDRYYDVQQAIYNKLLRYGTMTKAFKKSSVSKLDMSESRLTSFDNILIMVENDGFYRTTVNKLSVADMLNAEKYLDYLLAKICYQRELSKMGIEEDIDSYLNKGSRYIDLKWKRKLQ